MSHFFKSKDPNSTNIGKNLLIDFVMNEMKVVYY